MSFNLNSFAQALSDPNKTTSGVDFSGKSLKLDSDKDAQPIVEAINKCPNLHYLTLTGNTLGVDAAKAIAKALEHHPELKVAQFSDMFTGRMKTEIPPALKALGDGMIEAGARLQVLDLSDNAFGPIGVEGLAKLLESDVCSQLQELRLNNNGLGITGGKLLAKALSANPRKLKVFVAGRNRLENDGAKALAEVFKTMGTLEEVSMPQNGIYHAGISALAAALGANPRLATLNFNDNTLTHKAAGALALALPRLKNLKFINFGDCLLKSKGARALAKAFKENAQKLESLDLSHNEIGREACMEIVDAITTESDAAQRLTKVVLSGNSLGGATNKKIMKQKLGASADLSDGEGSEDEYETESENDEESEDDEESGSESDQTKVECMGSVGKEIVLDSSGAEEIESEVEKFLRHPTVENFEALGVNAAELIDAHLQKLTDPSEQMAAHVDAAFSVAGLNSRSTLASEAASQLIAGLLRRGGALTGRSWLLADAMLRGLGLIKSEHRRAPMVPGHYAALAASIEQPYFPAALRDTLRFFISSKLDTMPPEVATVVRTHQALLS